MNEDLIEVDRRIARGRKRGEGQRIADDRSLQLHAAQSIVEDRAVPDKDLPTVASQDLEQDPNGLDGQTTEYRGRWRTNAPSY